LPCNVLAISWLFSCIDCTCHKQPSYVQVGAATLYTIARMTSIYWTTPKRLGVRWVGGIAARKPNIKHM
jgi:hypothetical protein